MLSTISNSYGSFRGANTTNATRFLRRQWSRLFFSEPFESDRITREKPYGHEILIKYDSDASL